MTREEAKQLLPIIQAYSEGKTIQRYRYDSKEWYDVPSYMKIDFLDKPEHLRIKPEPKYRPFKDAEECWNEMQKHQPFGWVKVKEREMLSPINMFDKFTKEGDRVIHVTGTWHDLDDMFDSFTFADGTPFGVKIEEE